MSSSHTAPTSGEGETRDPAKPPGKRSRAPLGYVWFSDQPCSRASPPVPSGQALNNEAVRTRCRSCPSMLENCKNSQTSLVGKTTLSETQRLLEKPAQEAFDLQAPGSSPRRPASAPLASGGGWAATPRGTCACRSIGPPRRASLAPGRQSGVQISFRGKLSDRLSVRDTGIHKALDGGFQNRSSGNRCVVINELDSLSTLLLDIRLMIMSNTHTGTATCSRIRCP